MSKPDEADDLYADLYGEEAQTTVVPAPAAQPETVSDPRAQPARQAAGPEADSAAGGSFIPGMPSAAPPSSDTSLLLDNADARSAAAARGEHVAPQDLPDEGKMFVGGLNWDTTEEGLRKYFGQFGPVSSCTVMRDGASGRSRGFAFVTFADPKSVNAVMVREHYLDGKIIDPKRAIPRPEQSKTQKCFVGGLPQTVTQDSFRKLFQQFGHVLDSTVMMDKDTGRPRGFGFVTFEDDEGVEKTLATQPLLLDGKPIEVKRAQSRGQAPTAAPAGRFSSCTNDTAKSGAQAPLRMWGAGADAGAKGGMPAAQGAFDPQAMAKMYQQMGWGSSAWNPQMMWQQMMSAYMGGGAAKSGWNAGAQGASNPAAAYMRAAYSGAGAGGNAGAGANPPRGGADAQTGWGGRGQDESRGRQGGSGSGHQREHSPVRGSRNYDERNRF
ncbi:hypothetical protein MVES1_003221 [Malassezia vespertilionis]|uniref:RRM domain-containing protein n=1 Tax=Malassezia vespertilionis TaxID=2020962 RepID=A0A2N1J9S4_9BASI|nr:uncharacterized protein MVES1_003221 [Malassezia vespertilionis]PKI83232.1 hypothetical protein MVES_003062 [Malassezia vespertilionis]WFD07854.1 hypothetical protein MVES1_003221 [Malassezia vespertilionis]